MIRKSFYIFLILAILFNTMLGIENFAHAQMLFNELPPFQNIIMQNENLYTLAEQSSLVLKTFPKDIDTSLIQANELLQKALQTPVSLDNFQLLLRNATIILQKQRESFLKKKVHKQENSTTFYEQSIYFDANAILHIIGDQHGSFHDTVNFFNALGDVSPFEESSFLLKPEYRHHHWIFCGDLTDGGVYGVETLALILSVFIQNPNNIHIIRGNHEDININWSYGFNKELELKYGKELENQIPLLILRTGLQLFYNELPVALWGVFSAKIETARKRKMSKKQYDVFLFCHGGIERQDKNIADLCKNCILNKKGISYKAVHGNFHDIGDLGYLWNDINSNAEQKKTKLSGRGANCFILSQYDITNYIKSEFAGTQFQFRHIFRAHQHAPSYTGLMPTFFKNNGICQIGNPKNPMVTTLLVMPGTFAGIPLESNNFPGVIQAVPVILYQSEKLIIAYCFRQLPNDHISDRVFAKHNQIMKKIGIDKKIAVKQYKSHTVRSSSFDKPLWY